MKFKLILIILFLSIFSCFFAPQKAMAVVCNMSTFCDLYTVSECNWVQSGPYQGYAMSPCTTTGYNDCNLCENYGNQCGYCDHTSTSSCVNQGRIGGTGYYLTCTDGSYSPSDSQCSGLGDGYNWIVTSACIATTCNSGIVCSGWSACGGSPTNTCNAGNGSQSRTCHYTTLSGGGICNPSNNFTQNQSCTDNNCSTNYSCTGGSCTTHINVHVYKDYNHDGVVNGADGGFQGVSVTDGSGAQTTDSTGYTIFTGETTGTYTITITVPTNWHVLGSNPSKTVTLTNTNGNVDVTFFLTPLYSISGNLFNDNNHNANYDGGDTLYTGSTTVHVVGVSPVSDMTQTDGTYATSTSLESGTYTVSLTSSLPSGYTMTTGKSWTVVVGNPTGSPDCNVGTSPDAICGGVNNGSVSGLNFGINPPYQISGNLFIDANHNKNYDTGDSLYTGSTTVHITGPSTVPDMTQTDGTYSTGQVLLPGTYTVSLTSSLPTGYSMTTTTSWTVTVGYNPTCAIGGSPDATCGNPNGGSINNLNFGIDLPYRITGNVFNDNNLNGKYDPAPCSNPDPSKCDSGVSNIKIAITGPINTSPITNAVGAYSTGQNLLPGTYTVTYSTALPNGYRYTTPSSFVVIVGYNPACNTGGSSDATCGDPNGGSISNLNFGITNENTWSQIICGDLRTDAGYSQIIPSTADCNGTSAPYAITDSSAVCTNIPGVLFSGGVDPSYGGGLGASTSNSVVGDVLFPELFSFRLPHTSEASFNFLSTTFNNLLTSPISLTSICPNLTACTLSKNTPGGVYTTTAADGPVNISINNTDGTFDLGPADYTFAIGGDVTFKTKLTLQNGYGAAFTSGGDIHVASTVGETDWTSTAPDLEGFFTADKSFILDTATTPNNLCLASGEPIDKKLNIVGSVSVNNALGGGTLQNNRVGCIENTSCPTTTITISPGLILHAPGPLKPSYSFWQELNP